MPANDAIDVRRAEARFVTRSPGVETLHSFSFGTHYDPVNVGHGCLVTHDEHRLAPGAGFPPHPHRGLDIVTWVLAGRLRHEDDTGTVTDVSTGGVQVLCTGDGVLHGERNASTTEPVRFLQAWLIAEPGRSAPTYTVLDRGPDLDAGEWVSLCEVPGASLLGARLAAGEVLVVPAVRRAHLFVARGQVSLGGQMLDTSDAARLTGAGELRLVTKQPAEL
ncbi:MAG: pirin family protein, partial [Mycobacteriales bacterium]